jgi:hypothetical protein
MSNFKSSYKAVSTTPPPLVPISNYDDDISTQEPSPPLVTSSQVDDLDDYEFFHQHELNKNLYNNHGGDNDDIQDVLFTENLIETAPPSPQISNSMPDLEPLSQDQTSTMNQNFELLRNQQQQQQPQQPLSIKQTRMTPSEIRSAIQNVYTLVSDVKRLLSVYGKNSSTTTAPASLLISDPSLDNYLFVLDVTKSYTDLTRAVELLNRIKKQ